MFLSKRQLKKLQTYGRRVWREAVRHCTNPSQCSNWPAQLIATDIMQDDYIASISARKAT